MGIAVIATFTYGIIALAGGVMGYLKAKSKVSLISGGLSGLLLLGAGVMQILGLAGGLLLAQIITTVLIIVFAIRLFKTRKLMPSGLMLVAGLVASVMMWQVF